MALETQSRVSAARLNERLEWGRKQGEIIAPNVLRILPDLSAETLERLRVISPEMVDDETEALFKMVSETKVPWFVRLFGGKDEFLLNRYGFKAMALRYRLDALMRTKQIHVEHSEEELRLLEECANEIARLTPLCDAETSKGELLALNAQRVRTALVAATDDSTIFRPEFVEQVFRLSFKISAAIEKPDTAESKLHALMLEQDIQEPFLTN